MLENSNNWLFTTDQTNYMLNKSKYTMERFRWKYNDYVTLKNIT